MATTHPVATPGGAPMNPGYPVHVWAGADPRASRGLWLVKWLLLIPHLVVLAFLWIAFGALSLVAFVAIVATGRYPRWAFDFNVGVLRWSWRVAYYGYGALATDQYPPFTLDEVADYPAHLEVDYPERLSRGLVLVKWWLLALPHYIIVGILIGGAGWWVANDHEPWRVTWGGGMVGLLAILAAGALLFTGRYPRGIYDLLLGLNRWVLRVAAYVSLMTDAYPPFRLDMGPEEPDGSQGAGAVRLFAGPSAQRAALPPPSDTPSDTPPRTPPDGGAGPGVSGAPAPTGGRWTGGRITSLVAGILAGLLSLGMLTGGIALLVADTALRDHAGYVTTVERPLSSGGYAVAVTSVVLDASPGQAALPGRILGQVRVRVTPTDPARSVFVGIAPSAQIDRYLAGVARTVPGTGWRSGTDIAGSAPATPPTELAIWDAQVVGSGTQELFWTPRAGTWGVVLMNADASVGVSVSASVGAELPWLGPVGALCLVLGILLLAGGVTAVAVAVHRARRSPPTLT